MRELLDRNGYRVREGDILLWDASWALKVDPQHPVTTHDRDRRWIEGRVTRLPSGRWSLIVTEYSPASEDYFSCFYGRRYWISRDVISNRCSWLKVDNDWWDVWMSND